jgi:hypothetical protein
MKTAMQELILKLPNEFIFDNPIIILEALKKEKEQIKSAFEFGLADAYNFIEDEAEEYYNQTYKE